MQITSAFVTGGTGLLGNNLVRLLVQKGVKARALVRNPEKAKRQFGDLPVEVVKGDMGDVSSFAGALAGVDAVFHTAAYFRDSYKGGRHREQLDAVNVDGTAALLKATYRAGVRDFVHTSSIAVLSGPKGSLIDETMRRPERDADDYYASKIRTDAEVDRFLAEHPDFRAVLVLPGWMHGPGDMGPTSAGQTVIDFARRRIPGLIPATFSVVDARDVAEAEWLALQHGRRGERYLAAGRNFSMDEIASVLERVTEVAAPKRRIPMPLLYAIAGVQESWARVSGKPVLLSLAVVRLMANEAGRTSFNHAKSERELGIHFRSLEETLRDEVEWFRENGMLPANQKLQVAAV